VKQGGTMKKYFLLIAGLLFFSCSTAPKIEVPNPHEKLLPKAEMEKIILQRYFSFIHCRGAEVTLLEIQSVITEGGKEVIPVIAAAEFEENTGVGGWRKSRVTALYHFYKNTQSQWKVEKNRELTGKKRKK
jgi:hypothetical protein